MATLNSLASDCSDSLERGYDRDEDTGTLQLRHVPLGLSVTRATVLNSRTRAQ